VKIPKLAALPKFVRILGISLIVLIILGGFYGIVYSSVSSANYAVHRKVRQSIVDHPEFIPTASTVRFTSAGFDALVADLYWLGAIQYIGENAISAEYKNYLGVMLELITDLSPHFTYPYQTGLLLLPEVNERYETRSAKEKTWFVNQAIALGKKGIAQNCDAKKIAQMETKYNLDELFADTSLRNSCSDGMIPYYLAYASYWNNNDAAAAAYYYRIAGLQDTAPKWARLMSAIMQGKSWDREKAIIMFLSLGESLDSNPNGICQRVTAELRDILIPAFANKARFTPAFIKEVERIRAAAKIELGDNQEEIERTDIGAYCSSYLDKSARELNLAYVSEADDRYFTATGKHAKHAQELFELGYLEYLPRDYQKQDETYEIIYVYNLKTEKWDFEMGNYKEYTPGN
jgi:hypothetical protein